MFEPITLPIAMSLFFLRAATIEVINSGSEVPAAIMVNPIIFWLIPKSVAMSKLLSTTNLPPISSPLKPIRIKVQILIFDF